MLPAIAHIQTLKHNSTNYATQIEVNSLKYFVAYSVGILKPMAAVLVKFLLFSTSLQFMLLYDWFSLKLII